jgi:transposase
MGYQMEVVHERCAGLDVHKKTVAACRIILHQTEGWQREIRPFKPMTADLLELADWLASAGVTPVAVESTGVYWKPIFNMLESQCQVILTNAQQVKYVPGHKTDVKDAQWLAELLQQGWLKASFIPSAPQRALRDLVRCRTQLTQERSREINRLQKVLEDSNLKIGSVVSDVMGASARDILTAIIDGQQDPCLLAQFAGGRMRSKVAELQAALSGRVQDHHRLLCGSISNALMSLPAKLKL